MSTYFSSNNGPLPKTFTTLGSGGRPVNGTSFTVGLDRDAFVTYNIGFSGLFAPTILLEISETGSTWTEIARINAGSGDEQSFSGMIPRRYQVRLNTTSGTTNFISGQEVLI